MQSFHRNHVRTHCINCKCKFKICYWQCIIELQNYVCPCRVCSGVLTTVSPIWGWAGLGFGQRGSTRTRVRGEHTWSSAACCERFCLSDLNACSPEKVFLSCALSCCTSELLLLSRVKLTHTCCHLQGWSVLTAA